MDYRWNAGAGRFVDARGRFVSRAAIRSALDRAIMLEKRTMLSSLVALRKKTISVQEWHFATRQRVKILHLWALATARGGWDAVSPVDYAYVGGILKAQFARLDRFAGEIALGLPLDGRAVVRLGMYADHARAMYHQLERQVATGAGYTEERNILNPIAEHCAACLQITTLGWVPLGSIPPVGGLTCLSNDRCYRDYR